MSFTSLFKNFVPFQKFKILLQTKADANNLAVAAGNLEKSWQCQDQEDLLKSVSQQSSCNFLFLNGDV